MTYHQDRRGWKALGQAQEVVRKVEARWKGGSLEIPDLRVAAVKEVAEDRGVHHQTTHRNLKQCFSPHLRDIHEFDEVLRRALPILAKLRVTDPGHVDTELHALRGAWRKS